MGRELATHREVRSEEESFERDEGVKALKGGGGEGSGEEVWCFDDDELSPLGGGVRGVRCVSDELGGGVSDSLLFSSLFEEWFVGCCCPSCFEGCLEESFVVVVVVVVVFCRSVDRCEDRCEYCEYCECNKGALVILQKVCTFIGRRTPRKRQNNNTTTGLSL